MAEMTHAHVYEILIGGALDMSWSDWFGGMAVEAAALPGGRPATRLRGQLPDQAALFGLLLRIRDVNLELISVERVNGG